MGCSLSKRSPEKLVGLGGPATPQAASSAVQRRVKLVLLGETGVGKTCLVTRFVRGAFDENSKVTVGVRPPTVRYANSAHLALQAAFCAQTVALPELGTSVKFEVWRAPSLLARGKPDCRLVPLSRDTAGQERYASLAPLYYRGAAAAAVVFDVTSAASFAKAHAWGKELQKHADRSCCITLVGNKTDLENREVSTEEAQAYAESCGIAYVETSAKSAEGVDALFTLIAQRCTQTQTPGP